MPEPAFSFKEMPKFKSPDEELSYLRAHVAAKEQELMDAGRFEHAKDVASNVISEYKQVPIAEVIPKDNIIKEEEARGIVLKLKPEEHDTVMEELLGIVITKGIRNAIAVAEGMNDPHIDDDFHRVLIQYLKT